MAEQQQFNLLHKSADSCQPCYNGSIAHDVGGNRMLETVAAQLRYTASIMFGLPFSARSLDRLVDALLATQREFGMIRSAGAELPNLSYAECSHVALYTLENSYE